MCIRDRRKGVQLSRKKSRPGYILLKSTLGKGTSYSICPKGYTKKEKEPTPGPGHYNALHMFELKNKKLGKFTKAKRDNFQSIYGSTHSRIKEPK